MSRKDVAEGGAWTTRPEAQLEALAEFRRVARLGAIVFVAGDGRWLRARRAGQARRGRRFDTWAPLRPSQVRDTAGRAGLRVVAILALLGPYAETRAVIMVSA